MHPVSELSDVAREFHHLQAEHSREGIEGSWRRRQGARLEELERTFETLLQRWVPSADEQTLWREHLYRGAERPHGEFVEPPAFRGRSELGSTVVVRPSEDELEVILDGTPVARWPKRRGVAAPLRFADSEFHELFEAPDAALDALLDYVERRTEAPPWQWARELYEDGLIDPTFGLTERGRRFHATRRG